MIDDPFDTAGLRATVLRAWQDSPARFREDANAEEALALGGYAGRALTELIANGVDAAEVDARVLVRWVESVDGPEFRVANVGRPLTATGVAALASLRASAKRRGGSVGHFGVGFTSVLTVSDRPQVHSRTAAAAIGFDLTASAAAVLEIDNPLLTTEVAARGGAVPVLRLPFPRIYQPPPDGYETEVVLPIAPRHLAAAADQFAAIGPDLLWALPGLTELTVVGPDGERWWRRVPEADGVTEIRSTDGTTRWAVVHTTGHLDPGLVADRPVEERDRTTWWITWVRPLHADLLGIDGHASTVGAPLPTDEPLTLPARLFGTFPVDDTRRRLAPGALTDHLLERAADNYPDLVVGAATTDRITLVPGGDFPAGPVDGTLTSRILDLLRTRALWDTATGDRLAGSALRWVDGLGDAAVGLLAPATPGLVVAPVSAAGRAALGRVGGRSIDLSTAVAELAVLDREPDFWRSVYSALAEAPADDLAAVPVPLAGGGRRIGPRAVLLPDPDLPAEVLVRLGQLVPDLPLVHPDAAHPALQRWGARTADAGDLLATAEVQQRLRDFRELLDDLDPDPDELLELAETVLDLLAHDRSERTVTDLVLTDDSGSPWPAAELLQPGAPLRRVLDPEEAAERPDVEHRWTRWSPEVLARAGVRAGFAVLAADPTQDLDALVADGGRWLDQVDPAADETLLLIADLDLVADDAWATALDLITADPRARAALLTPVGGARSQAAWWIARHARFGGAAPGQWRRAGSTDLAGICDPFPLTVDDSVAAAIGVSDTWADLVEADPVGLLRTWADPARTIGAGQVPAFTEAVRTVLAASDDLALPERLRTADGGVVDADRALVVDQPWPVQVLPMARLVPGGPDPAGLADLLEVDLISDLEFQVDLGAPVDPDPALLDRARAAAGAAGTSTLRHAPIRVTVEGRTQHPSWWQVDGTCWTDGSAAGIGAALAWTSGRWADRHRIIAAADGDWPDPTVGFTGSR